ncbi:retrovirus-related Pol polyprotein from transposon 17.6 [Trichonephila clavipes]|nr:retrovirus-related Pol polyprotein from transposon 17.6 [Trichonephila clavipes]
MHWAHEHRACQADWHQVVFSDESGFNLWDHDGRIRARRSAGERCLPEFVIARHRRLTSRVMVWGEISYRGRSDLLYELRLISIATAQHMQLLPWPAYSSDMSPIEHVWDLVGRRLARDPRPAASKDKLLLRIQAIWNSVPQADIKNLFDSSTRGLLATDHVILNHGQVTWTTTELAPSLLTTIPHQREDVSALDRFNVHRCPTRRVFSGTGLELVTRQATIRYLNHSATAATNMTYSWSPPKGLGNPPVDRDRRNAYPGVNKTSHQVTTQVLTRSLAETTLFSAVYNNYKSFISPVSISRLSVNTSSSESDQLKRKTPFEFKEYYLDEWANMNFPVQLAEKLEEFEDFKRTLKQKSSSPFVKKQEYKFTEKNRRYEATGKFEYNRKDKKFPASTNYNKHYEAPVTKYESVQRYQNSAQKGGSTVSLLRENTSRRIMDPTKLSKNKMLLTGIGEAQVTTIGSFEHEFKIDDENYSLTWHVVPADKLKFEAVIGSDLLEQALISFTKEGVKFNKYENHAQLMQISAENLQELDLRHVENRQIKKELEKLIQDYKPEKTASTDVTMRIILKNEEPVCQHPRRLAFTERQEVNKQIEEWLNEGIIRPSSSEYASPIVMVKKKDGSSRMCSDYRKLNQKLVKDKFPLPIIEDVLDTLQEAKVYSTLDLRNGFFHVDVDDYCRKYTSFIVPDGQFEFNKVPFGLSTSPGVFQRYVSSIFRDLTRKGIVISYLDDLVIPAKNEQEGLEKLKIIFEVAKKYGLEIKFKKSQFLKKKIEFLGHIVESGTIKPSPTKTLAVRKFPEPTTIKQVQSFLGLTGYFRKYIKDYSKIAKPLSDLTRKENLFVFSGLNKKKHLKN